MTISSEVSLVDSAGNGVTVAFTVGFRYLAKSHVVVTLVDDATGVETLWTLNTHYTLTDPGDNGTITAMVAPVFGKTLRRKRVVPLTQEIDYGANDTFPAENHEQGLDLGVMRDQQLQRQIDDILENPPMGAKGDAGSDGVSFRSGVGVPSDTLGSNGDGYVDVTPGQGLTYKKTAGSYAPDGGSLRGPAGASGTGTGDLVAANNLSDLDDATEAREHLGLGDLAVLDVADLSLGDLASKDAVDVSDINDAQLQALGGLTSAGIVVMTTPTTAAVRTMAAVGPLSLSDGGGASGDPTITTSMNSGKLLGRSSSSVGVAEEIAVGSGLALSSGTISVSGSSGKLAQLVSTIDTNANSISSSIPMDNTTPQITEGESIVTRAITPTNASSQLKIEVEVPIYVSGTPSSGAEPEVAAVTALFVQGTAGALAAVTGPRVKAHDNGATSGPNTYLSEGVARLSHVVSAASTSPRTYEVRVGKAQIVSGGTQTVIVNGTATLGGVRGARITVTEILP